MYKTTSSKSKGYKLTPEEDLIKTILKRFKLASEAEVDIRRLALDDLNFTIGKQWPEDVERERQLERRPCLTVNRLAVLVRQVVNEQRKNRPAIKIDPVGGGADIETAKIIQGLIRHIEVDSKADSAYDTAFSCAVKSGFGYLRLTTEYADPMSFDQDIKIKRIKNPFTVYFDPSCKEVDYSDANWCVITEVMSREEYEDQFPNSEVYNKLMDFSSMGDGVNNWIMEGGVRIAEYYYKEYENTAIYLLNDGSVVDNRSKILEGLFEIGCRDTRIPKIKWVKTNGVEILDSTDILGSTIPIIPVLGDEVEVDGKRVIESLVRHAKDSQRMYNYWSSAQTETIALAPKSPFIAAEGQLESYEQSWRLSNVKNTPFLYYKPVSLNGEMAPPPQRSQIEPPIQAITMAKGGSSDDLKATTGVYDAAIGNQGNERSGKAILNRTIQVQTSSFHFADNFSRALKRVGEVILEWIPDVYSSDRIISIIREDGSRKEQNFNGVNPNSVDLSKGKFAVVVDTGPSFSTKRQEAATTLMELGQVYPQAMPLIGDLIVSNMDWEGSKEAALRLKPGGGDVPPQVSAQMNQMKQTIDKLTVELNIATDKLHHREEEIKSRERIATDGNKTKLITELMKHDSKDAQLAFTEQLAHEQHRLSLIGDSLPVSNVVSENTKQVIQNSTGGIPTESP